MGKLLLSVREGRCGYGSAEIVTGVRFDLFSGDFLILEGENGSGKSTLLKTLLGYLPPLSGAFDWKISPREIGYVPQDIALDLAAPATALEVVQTNLAFSGTRADALAALALVGVAPQATQRFGTLSGGQRRRVLFARALAQNPTCFVLDEPTVNMDRETEAALGLLLHKQVTEHGRAVIATSHVREWLSHSRRCEIKEGLFYE